MSVDKLINVLVATGSAMTICLEARTGLKADRIQARVVRMPTWEVFEYRCRSHTAYREAVLPSRVSARVAVVQASTFGWKR